jgi:hypothetical protein
MIVILFFDKPPQAFDVRLLCDRRPHVSQVS